MNLVIQNGNVVTHINKYLDDVEIIKSFEKDVSVIDLNRYKTVIILGGHHSICDAVDQNLAHVIDLIKKCISLDKPLIGICLGCQLIAYALGCKIESSQKLNVGYDTQVCGFKNILRCHTNYIVPNVTFEFMEYYDSMLYVFKHNKIYGVQCHPDIPPEYVSDFVEDTTTIEYARKNNKEIDENNNGLMMYILSNLL
uniref:Glutamine amidotransferase domain-containing protein n=1 Tax=viral metagenome TaxID=1070528 RepID=A0A6C0C714_9ZZZZ